MRLVPSLGELVDQVIDTLHGHTTDVPATATLVGPLTAQTTELALDFGSVPWAGRPNGLVEIGDELVHVSSYEPTTGVATVPAWGRGQRGTVAQAHDAGVRVTVRPRYGRKAVARTINQVARSSCPPLFAATDLAEIDTGTLVDIGYPLPDNTIRVLRVEATDSLLSEEFADRRVLRNWRVRHVAGTQLLEIPRDEAYQTVQVTVAALPGEMTAESDDFATVTGLPEAAADMVMFGTIARLVLGAELARQQVTTVEAQSRAEKVPAGSGTTISRYYQALYTQRLEQERDRLQQMYPLQLLRRG